MSSYNIEHGSILLKRCKVKWIVADKLQQVHQIRVWYG